MRSILDNVISILIQTILFHTTQSSTHLDLPEPGTWMSEAFREKKSLTMSHLTIEAGSPGSSLM